MRPGEKWPHRVYNGEEIMLGDDNGCFYRWARLGVCVGPVDRVDSRGNHFCRYHELVARESREAAPVENGWP